MNCWHCERPAHGICAFCGRGICRDHMQTMPSLVSLYRHKDERMRAIAVNDTLYCGICKPAESPVVMEELDQ